jgi:hypothetical protein
MDRGADDLALKVTGLDPAPDHLLVSRRGESEWIVWGYTLSPHSPAAVSGLDSPPPGWS